MYNFVCRLILSQKFLYIANGFLEIIPFPVQLPLKLLERNLYCGQKSSWKLDQKYANPILKTYKEFICSNFTSSMSLGCSFFERMFIVIFSSTFSVKLKVKTWKLMMTSLWAKLQHVLKNKEFHSRQLFRVSFG